MISSDRGTVIYVQVQSVVNKCIFNASYTLPRHDNNLEDSVKTELSNFKILRPRKEPYLSPCLAQQDYVMEKKKNLFMMTDTKKARQRKTVLKKEAV